MGDLHGRSQALKEVLDRSGFDLKNDKLILLGDIADGGPDTRECVEILLKVKNLVFVYGNHDCEWTRAFLVQNQDPGRIWKGQGGMATLESYGFKPSDPEEPEDCLWVGPEIPEDHKQFWNSGVYWHEENNMLFVHGGINPLSPVDMQTPRNLMWDRSMALNVIQCRGHIYEKYAGVTRWDHIFLGHTAIGDPWLPVTSGRITVIDTGAGHCGKLTLMNIHTKQFWQSEKTDPAF